jgi:hypothetical protein
VQHFHEHGKPRGMQCNQQSQEKVEQVTITNVGQDGGHFLLQNVVAVRDHRAVDCKRKNVQSSICPGQSHRHEADHSHPLPLEKVGELAEINGYVCARTTNDVC